MSVSVPEPVRGSSSSSSSGTSSGHGAWSWRSVASLLRAADADAAPVGLGSGLGSPSAFSGAGVVSVAAAAAAAAAAANNATTMTTTTTDANAALLVVDTRAPCEFAEDHVPGAVNAPVLSDEERVAVGTMHQRDPFEARRRGAALISRNIAALLETRFAKTRQTQPIAVYCLRAGQRSRSLATVLAAIGFANVSVVEGGYRAYRAHVQRDVALQNLPPGLSFTVLAGLTGSGKTKLLREMERAGKQTLDLERYANHRGSVFGSLPSDGPQPTQKMFESLLARGLRRLSPAKDNGRVYVEGESMRIGRVGVPLRVFERAILGADDVEWVDVPLEQRVSNILEDYASWFDAPEAEFRARLDDLLRASDGNKRLVDDLLVLARQNRREEFVAEVLKRHYDIKYLRSKVRRTLEARSSGGGGDVVVAVGGPPPPLELGSVSMSTFAANTAAAATTATNDKNTTTTTIPPYEHAARLEERRREKATLR